MPKKVYLTRTGVEYFFNEVEKTLNFNRESNHPETVERSFNEFRTEKARILALYDERRAKFDRWEELAGVKAAEEEASRKVAILREIEYRIIDYTPETSEEAAQKALYFLNNWQEDENSEFAFRFIRSLILNPLTS